ncbi:hypothetical protein EDD18DRAFT_182913 [Armillaria luteobubalina]|uniref:F-box domain-containing protein n=1 Tax=Armillaria luteobubalina TaxID=153913 RepID=A0AA39Q716_9AGAR|nr:hypothetical protein EDD18DRAFT_182913 [Armillaria luteobubalina]
MASGCIACPKCGSDVSFTSVDQLNVPVFSPAALSLRNNDLPNASDIHSLKESAQYIDDALGHVEADIHRLSDILSRLEEKQTLFRDAQKTHKIILSPIRRLHPDVLVQIFLATGPSYVSDPCAYNVFDVSSGPWLVGQVCSKWRAVVASHSALWSTMWLNVSWPLGDIFHNLDILTWRHVGELKGPIPLLNSALSRSGQHNLSFQFSCDNQTDTEILEIMSTLFHLLSSHCKRWENVYLRIPASIAAALSSIRGLLPMLTCLKLSFLEADEQLPLHIDAFSIAPRLARAQLIDVPDGIHVYLAKPGLVHFLEHRSGNAPANTYLLDIIQMSPHLRNFLVRAARGRQLDSETTPSPRVISTSLRELQACDGEFLRSLVLPALEAILILPFFDELACPPDTLAGLHTLLSQSRCSLTRLAMKLVTPDDHLSAILELVPTLTSLTFEQCYTGRQPWPESDGDVYQKIITRMKTTSVDSSGRPHHLLLPNLEKLSFTIMADPPQDTHSHCIVNHDFAEMVISRWDSYDEPSLSSVSVEFQSSSPWELPGLLPDDIASLKHRKTEQFDIVIRSRTFSSGTIEYV